MRKDAKELDELIRERVVQWRQERALTHDQLAARFRAVGLDMSRSAVTAFERDGRKFSVGEVALICLALEVTPQAMLEGDEMVKISAATVPLDSLRRFFRTTRAKVGDVEGFEPFMTNYREERERQTARGAAEIAAQFAHLHGGHWAEVERAATLEAEVRAAARLGLSAHDLAMKAFSLWGRSLTDERDARAAKRVTRDMPDRSTRMVRAHITRQLEAELRKQIEAAAD